MGGSAMFASSILTTNAGEGRFLVVVTPGIGFASGRYLLDGNT